MWTKTKMGMDLMDVPYNLTEGGEMQDCHGNTIMTFEEKELGLAIVEAVNLRCNRIERDKSWEIVFKSFKEFSGMVWESLHKKVSQNNYSDDAVIEDLTRLIKHCCEIIEKIRYEHLAEACRKAREEKL